MNKQSNKNLLLIIINMFFCCQKIQRQHQIQQQHQYQQSNLKSALVNSGNNIITSYPRKPPSLVGSNNSGSNLSVQLQQQQQQQQHQLPQLPQQQQQQQQQQINVGNIGGLAVMYDYDQIACKSRQAMSPEALKVRRAPAVLQPPTIV